MIDHVALHVLSTLLFMRFSSSRWAYGVVLFEIVTLGKLNVFQVYLRGFLSIGPCIIDVSEMSLEGIVSQI